MFGFSRKIFLFALLAVPAAAFGLFAGLGALALVAARRKRKAR